MKRDMHEGGPLIHRYSAVLLAYWSNAAPTD